MAYVPTVWKNREVERPRTFTIQDNGDGTVTLIPAEGQVIEPGTPIIAANMNKIEQGIVDAHENAGKVKSVNGKIGDVVLNAADVGAETPSGAQTKVNTHANLQAHSSNVHGLRGYNLAMGSNSQLTDGSTGQIAIGWNSKTANNYAISLGTAATSGDMSIAIGYGASATRQSGIAIGYGASAIESSYNAIAIGDGSIATQQFSVAIGSKTNAINHSQGVLGVSSSASAGPKSWLVPGTFSVTGTKNFEIPHPAEHKKATHVIRHGAVESPTPGDTLYRYTIEATADGQTVEMHLPDYFEALNTNVDVWVNGHQHFGRAYGVVEGDILKVTCETAGAYKVLIIGTRNDENVQDWYVKGVEREIGESWLGETYVFEVDEIMEVEEIKNEEEVA